MINRDELIAAARVARGHARAPYSTFPVGAALLASSGRIFTGCNIESASYGLTICAERVAVFKAVSEGEAGFNAVAVVTDRPMPAPPCGACRQILWEVCGDIEVILANLHGHVEVHRLTLPRSDSGKPAALWGSEKTVNRAGARLIVPGGFVPAGVAGALRSFAKYPARSCWWSVPSDPAH